MPQRTAGGMLTRGVAGLFALAAASSLLGCEKASKGPALGEATSAAKAPEPGTAGTDARAVETVEPKPAAKSAVVLTDANFAERTAKGVALVDFWAPWCPPCSIQGPIVEKVAKQYAGRALVGKLDADANRETAVKLGIRGIPTLILFKDGKEYKRLVSLQDEAKLKAALDEALGE